HPQKARVRSGGDVYDIAATRRLQTAAEETRISVRDGCDSARRNAREGITRAYRHTEGTSPGSNCRGTHGYGTAPNRRLWRVMERPYPIVSISIINRVIMSATSLS